MTDPDFHRQILLRIVGLQRAPPEAFFLDVDDLQVDLGRSREEIFATLESLKAMNLIEGPGFYREGWLFRLVTAKGRMFVQYARDEGDWSRIKKAYEA